MSITLSRNNSADILRIFAFLLVFFFHSRREWASYGYLGVELFIFLSGFLLGSLNYEQPKIFLLRRLQTLLPPFLLFCFISFVFVQFFSFPHITKVSSIQALLSPLGLGHWYIANNVGYFGTEGVLIPTLHLWSLSQEVTFYLIASLLINKNYFKKIAIIIFFLMLYLLIDNLTVDKYFDALSRFVFFSYGYCLTNNENNKSYTEVIFFLIVIATYFIGVFTESQLLLMLIFTVLSRCVLLPDPLKIIPIKFTTFLQCCSKRVYVYYLFHYLGFSACATILKNSYFSNIEIVIVFLFTIIIGEVVFRLSKLRIQKHITFSLIICILSVLFVNSYNGQLWRLRDHSKFEYVKNNGVAVLDKVKSLGKNSSNCDKTFIGDSHARHLYYLYKNAGFEVNYKKATLEDMNYLLSQVKNRCKPNLAFRWSTENDYLIEDLIQKLKLKHQFFYIWEEFPSFNFDPRKCLISQNWYLKLSSKCVQKMDGFIKINHKNNIKEKFDIIQNSLSHNNINFLQQRLCKNKKCKIFIDGKLFYRDWHHISENIKKISALKLINLIEK